MWSETFFLKASSEAQLLAALPGDWVQDGLPVLASHTHSLDWFGALVTTPAVLDAEGDVISPAVVADGFHANLRLYGQTPMPAGLEPYVLNPEPMFPKRDFA